jgi:FkbM family methyltransferase
VAQAERNWRRWLRHHLLAPVTGEKRHAGPGRPFELAELRTRPRRVNEARVRALARAVRMGGDDALARALGRYMMVVDAGDLGLSAHLLLDGFWEMWLTEAMTRHVRPGMIVADVGANLGYYTLLLGELVGAAGRVHAFEPNPALARRLRASLALNKTGARTTLHDVALGDADGEAALVVPAGDPKNGALVAAGSRADARSVAVRRMDALPDLAEVDLIKIDVEGAEEAVWRGMSGILARPRPLAIFLEFNPSRYADPRGFLAAIERNRFRVDLLELSGEEVPLARAGLWDRPGNEDQMLLLRR